MTANTNRESAKIFDFRTGARLRSPEAIRQARFAAEIAAVKKGNFACADSWYHEEAVQGAETPSRH